MSRRRLLALLTVPLVAIGVLVAPAPAYAGCQSTSVGFQVDTTDGWTILATCSGSFTVNEPIRRVTTRSWSGYFYYDLNGYRARYNFCDGQVLTTTRYIYWVYLSPTRATWC
jgi:hypothetical protein